MFKYIFIKLLQRAYLTIDSGLKMKFNRSLPFADAIFDRWERAEYLGFGKGSSIYNSSAVFGSVIVGENTWIGPFTLLDGSGGGLHIGSNCSISSGVHIYTHDTVKYALSGGKHPPYKEKVTVGDNTHIGAQTVIRAGVNIGSQCVIGANSFVTTSVSDNRIYGGSPAKELGTVDVSGDDIKLTYHSKVRS